MARLTPLFSKEMSLQAHFTFGAQTVGGPHAEVPRISTNALCLKNGQGEPSKNKHFCWTGDGGSHCSMACSDTGMSVAYNRTPNTSEVTRNLSYTSPLPVATVSDDCEETRSKPDLPLRSLTFSGPNKSPRTDQKQYNRRCKSTAHIVLQRDDKTSKGTPHEFHSTGHRNYSKPREKLDDRPGSRQNKKPTNARNTSALPKVEEMEGCSSCHLQASAPCCSCHHCAAHLISSLPCSCQSCVHFYQHLRHHMPCQAEPLAPHHSCCRSHHYSHSPDRCSKKYQGTSTFNSHRAYHDEPRSKKHYSDEPHFQKHYSGEPRSTKPYSNESQFQKQYHDEPLSQKPYHHDPRGRSPRRNSSGRHGKSPSHRSSSRRHKSFQERPIPEDRKDIGPRLPRVGVAYPSLQVLPKLPHLDFSLTYRCYVPSS